MFLSLQVGCFLLDADIGNTVLICGGWFWSDDLFRLLLHFALRFTPHHTPRPFPTVLRTARPSTASQRMHLALLRQAYRTMSSAVAGAAGKGAGALTPSSAFARLPASTSEVRAVGWSGLGGLFWAVGRVVLLD